MLAGQATVAMSLLIPPAVFAASLDHFDLFGDAMARTRTRHWLQLVFLALAAWLLSAVGPTVAESLAALVSGKPLDAVPAAPQRVLEIGRSLIPVTIGLFAIVSGVAGGLVGQLTRRSGLRHFFSLRWLACLALVASFWFPFLVTASLVLQRGASVLWIVCLPLALPFTLTGAMAWWLCRRRRVHSGAVGPGKRAKSREAESFDRIVSMVIAGDERVGSSTIASAETKAELEMARLAVGIRRVVAPTATISQKRVQGIVNAMLEVPPSTDPMPSAAVGPRGNRAILGDFCSSWIALAAGLLMVSPLGGVPPSIVSAATAGFFGSVAILVLGRRNDTARMAVAS